MARFIDMTDAQKRNLQQREDAKRRATILAKPAAVLRQLAELEAEAVEIEAAGGRFADKQAARVRGDKQPIFAMLTRLNINPADIGIAA